MIEIKKSGKKVRANDEFRAKSINLITEVNLDIAAIHGYLMLIAVIETGELILYFTENKNKIGRKFDSWDVYYEYEEIEYIDSIVNNNNHSYILLDCKPTYSHIATKIVSEICIAVVKNTYFEITYFSHFHALFFNTSMNYQCKYEDYQKNVIAKGSEDNDINNKNYFWLPMADAGVEIEMVDKKPEPVNQSQKIKSSANNIVASDSLKFEVTVNIRQIS